MLTVSSKIAGVLPNRFLFWRYIVEKKFLFSSNLKLLFNLQMSKMKRHENDLDKFLNQNCKKKTFLNPFKLVKQMATCRNSRDFLNFNLSTI